MYNGPCRRRNSADQSCAVPFEPCARGRCPPTAFGQNDWPAYGRDPGAQRYSPLKQINPGNVSRLVQAWTYETRPASDSGAKRISSTTPLMVNNVLYFATPYQNLI